MDVKGRELDVLEAVASMDEAYAYNIQKDVEKKDAKKGRKGITYKTVHSKLKELKSKELIEFFREKKTKRGANAIIYKPTVAGIAKLLDSKISGEDLKTMGDEEKRKLEKIIGKNQGSIPLVFGKWRFIKEVLEKRAWSRLKRASESYLQSLSSLNIPFFEYSFETRERKRLSEKESEKQSAEFITEGAAKGKKELFAFYYWDPSYPQYVDSPPFSNTEIKKLNEDKEIRRFLIRLLKKNLKIQETKREQLKFLESQASKDKDDMSQ